MQADDFFNAYQILNDSNEALGRKRNGSAGNHFFILPDGRR